MIGDSITSIGDAAFSWCTDITSIEVDEDNTAYRGIDGNLYTINGKILIQYAIGKNDVTFDIPDSVTSIGSSAFSGCEKLMSIVMPDSVTSIGGRAFYRCESLTDVYYTGTEAEWTEITIHLENENLTNATRYYYSETEPTESGNFWHYDAEGNVTVWGE